MNTHIQNSKRNRVHDVALRNLSLTKWWGTSWFLHLDFSSTKTKHKCVRMSLRKPRRVNNAYIDIDSVTIGPGYMHCNWKILTKQKLKERETKLLNIKIAQIETIINKQLSSLTLTKSSSYGYKINITLINNAINKSINDGIDKWKGVHFDRIKKKIATFRDYFVIGKNWWDIKKQPLISTYFWIALFKDIHQV